jgi:cytochrome c oxidase subunit III
MTLKEALFAPSEQKLFEHTFLSRERLEEQYATLEQQTETAAFGMWVFLATEVMFFGALFVSVGAYWLQYMNAVEHASVELNWIIGGINTVILLVSSLMMALAVHFAKQGDTKRIVFYLLLTAALGVGFLCFKGAEYYSDFVENLVPWRFDEAGWIAKGLSSEDVPHVRIFLLFYWIMTALHALHVTIGIVAVLIICLLAYRGHFSAAYYAPVDVLGLYWHFVDLVWIFLFPCLYLLGTHHL